MTPESIGWLIILAAIVAPLAWLVWRTRPRSTAAPVISADAELDLHCAGVPGLDDLRPSWDGAAS